MAQTISWLWRFSKPAYFLWQWSIASINHLLQNFFIEQLEIEFGKKRQEVAKKQVVHDEKL